MSADRDFSPLAIDPDSFAAALHAGALDACLVYARQNERSYDENAELNRRVAEALFHRGHRDEALECGRRALALAGSDPKILNFCAWLFSNCGCHEEAADAYRSLLELYPDWIEGYRHASGSLMAIGAITEAIDCAFEACARDPQNSEYALYVGSLLFRIGRRSEAAALAEEAAALAPDETATVIPAAELLMRCERADRAAEILRAAAAAHRADDSALFRVLSAAEMLLGCFEEALAAVDAALALAPEQADYHLHRGHVLARVGELSAAEAAFEDAAALDPTNPELKRAQIDLFLMQGRVTEATALGGELLVACPHDPGAAQAVMHVLGERLQTVEGVFVVLHDGIERPPRPLRPLPGFLDQLRSQRRVIRALIIRETRTRFGDSKLGYGWALLEPIMHIALLSLAFSVLMHGQPPIGSHFFLFYYTGLVPYHVFVHASSGMTHAITSNGALLQLPLVTTFDVIAARGLLEIITDVIVAATMLVLFAAAGLATAPDDLWGPLTALTVTALFGLGVGYFNAVLAVFWRSWDKVYAQVTRGLYFISGIFYVPGMMPDWAREALLWNPLLHAVDWFRSGFFAVYQPHWLDQSYLAILAILALLGGIALERGLRRKLSEPA